MSSKEDRLPAESISIEERIKLVALPLWSYRDVILYFNICQNHALQIIKAARTNNSAPLVTFTSKVPTDAVLNLFGTSRKLELETLRGEINDCNNGQE